MRRNTTHIVIHCADTPNGNDRYTIDDIRRWHVEENGWRDVGYHKVIHVDGSAHQGRHDDDHGAHCSGLNARSVGVSLVGRDKYTAAQWLTLRKTVEFYRREYPDAVVIGHNERSGKTCPGFDVQAWLAAGMKPLAAHLLDAG